MTSEVEHALTSSSSASSSSSLLSLIGASGLLSRSEVLLLRRRSSSTIITTTEGLQWKDQKSLSVVEGVCIFSHTKGNPDVQGSPKEWVPGCKNYSGKLRLRLQPVLTRQICAIYAIFT